MISHAEYDRRKGLAKKVVAELKGEIDGAILVGSMAYGIPETLQSDSDIDLVLIKNFKTWNNLNGGELYGSEIPKGLIILAKEGRCNTCTFDIEKERVKLALHFWDYSALRNVIELQGSNKKYAINLEHARLERFAYGISGKASRFMCNFHLDDLGGIVDAPIMETTEKDLFLFVQPMNLMLTPEKIYDSGIQIDERIEVFWQNLAAAYHKVFGEYQKDKQLLNAVPEKIKRRFSLQQEVNIETALIKALQQREKTQRFLKG